jgi:hypothetical protein
LWISQWRRKNAKILGTFIDNNKMEEVESWAVLK